MAEAPKGKRRIVLCLFQNREHLQRIFERSQWSGPPESIGVEVLGRPIDLEPGQEKELDFGLTESEWERVRAVIDIADQEQRKILCIGANYFEDKTQQRHWYYTPVSVNLRLPGLPQVTFVVQEDPTSPTIFFDIRMTNLQKATYDVWVIKFSSPEECKQMARQHARPYEEAQITNIVRKATIEGQPGQMTELRIPIDRRDLLDQRRTLTVAIAKQGEPFWFYAMDGDQQMYYEAQEVAEAMAYQEQVSAVSEQIDTMLDATQKKLAELEKRMLQQLHAENVAQSKEVADSLDAVDQKMAEAVGILKRLGGNLSPAALGTIQRLLGRDKKRHELLDQQHEKLDDRIKLRGEIEKMLLQLVTENAGTSFAGLSAQQQGQLLRDHAMQSLNEIEAVFDYRPENFSAERAEEEIRSKLAQILVKISGMDRVRLRGTFYITTPGAGFRPDQRTQATGQVRIFIANAAAGLSSWSEDHKEGVSNEDGTFEIDLLRNTRPIRIYGQLLKEHVYYRGQSQDIFDPSVGDKENIEIMLNPVNGGTPQRTRRPEEGPQGPAEESPDVLTIADQEARMRGALRAIATGVQKEWPLLQQLTTALQGIAQKIDEAQALQEQKQVYAISSKLTIAQQQITEILKSVNTDTLRGMIGDQRSKAEELMQAADELKKRIRVGLLQQEPQQAGRLVDILNAVLRDIKEERDYIKGFRDLPDRIEGWLKDTRKSLEGRKIEKAKFDVNVALHDTQIYTTQLRRLYELCADASQKLQEIHAQIAARGTLREAA